MSEAVEIALDSPCWDEEPAAEATVRAAVAAALAACGLDGAEVSVALTDDARMRALNRQWRGKDAPTNVLSFPAPAQRGAGARFLGDVALAFETIRREATAEARPFAHHLAHLAVHGTLHLSGFDHDNDADADLMERRERDILARLGVPDPYAPAAAQGTKPA